MNNLLLVKKRLLKYCIHHVDHIRHLIFIHARELIKARLNLVLVHSPHIRCCVACIRHLLLCGSASGIRLWNVLLGHSLWRRSSSCLSTLAFVHFLLGVRYFDTLAHLIFYSRGRCCLYIILLFLFRYSDNISVFLLHNL